MRRFSTVLLLSLGASFASAQQNTTSTTSIGSTPRLKADRGASGSLWLNLSGRRFDDEVVNSAYGRGIVGFTLKGNYQDWLSGVIDVGQVFSSGAASNLYAVTEGAPSSTYTYADEFSLTLKARPLDNLETKGSAGILKIVQNPILSALGPNSWAAGKLSAEHIGQDGKFGLSVTQGLPTAKDISNRAMDEDTLPLYTNGTVGGELTILKSNWKVQAATTAFVFTDPATSAAADSQKLGSTTAGAGKGMVFVYDYRGLESAAAIVREDQGGDKFTLKASTLTNSQAPETGKAVLGRLEYKRALEQWDITTGLTGFRIESDALPASYTSSSYGFTNRAGASLSLKAEQRKEKFALTFGYTKADVLDRGAPAAADGYQADREIYSLGAELSHDVF